MKRSRRETGRGKTRLRKTKQGSTPLKAPVTSADILDVGCGLRKRPGAIGIDINPRTHADVIHDLNQFPYPFKAGSFSEIVCENIIEHLDDVVKVMEELHRIAKPRATVTIVVPFFAHPQANTDPTHKHFFGTHSFDYFVTGTANGEFRYSSARYELVSVEFEKGLPQRHWIDRAVKSFANSRKDLYENRLAGIVPLRNLTFELLVVK